ncbi:hypothetical protein L6452_24969 [Arctium lappa]|uniref:Uncharacterized protein n=1 Tax=Arctium lappa TaxID=4217 RepID=A0ACB9A9V4_ARCLA|nr:hypothetical protein L6452_24969 [Arctium lappa]
MGLGRHLKKLLLSPSNHKTLRDVEQYFRRFDDQQQQTAIQKERSKKMEEQKMMFADHKPCLVLDLDHTLLNLAKDEMLKKKEEQDHEKPHRHPFRSPHMGMWTKLRHGIWNSLEKFYELHLYTMENKLYATEMEKVLDPKGVIFNGRVISRGDDGDSVDGNPKSNDLEGVLGIETSPMASITIRNLVLYTTNEKWQVINLKAARGFSSDKNFIYVFKIDHDERLADGTLASSFAVNTCDPPAVRFEDILEMIPFEIRGVTDGILYDALYFTDQLMRVQVVNDLNKCPYSFLCCDRILRLRH